MSGFCLQRLQRPIGPDQPCAALAVRRGPKAPVRIVLLFTPQEPIQFIPDISHFVPDCGFHHD